MLLPALSGALKGLKDLKDFHTLMIWTRQRPSSHYWRSRVRVFFFSLATKCMMPWVKGAGEKPLTDLSIFSRCQTYLVEETLALQRWW